MNTLLLTLLLLLALQLEPLDGSTPLLWLLDDLWRSDSDALWGRLRELPRLDGGLVSREDDDTRSRRRTSALDSPWCSIDDCERLTFHTSKDCQQRLVSNGNTAAEPTPSTDEISALHSNIKTKGTNSYYYAHKKREDVEIHEWDGKAITNYAWADGKKRVSVYLKLPGIGAHKEEDTHIDWTATSLTVKITNYEGKTRLLVMSKLYDEISDIITKRKEDQLVLQLVKAKEFSWVSLKKDA
ncbi:HSP20-like chaperone [Phytophthora cactorum]|nr:HSP20-like chaperone [Phytophthora cactorum]